MIFWTSDWSIQVTGCHEKVRRSVWSLLHLCLSVWCSSSSQCWRWPSGEEQGFKPRLKQLQVCKPKMHIASENCAFCLLDCEICICPFLEFAPWMWRKQRSGRWSVLLQVGGFHQDYRVSSPQSVSSSVDRTPNITIWQPVFLHHWIISSTQFWNKYGRCFVTSCHGRRMSVVWFRPLQRASGQQLCSRTETMFEWNLK